MEIILLNVQLVERRSLFTFNEDVNLRVPVAPLLISQLQHYSLTGAILLETDNEFTSMILAKATFTIPLVIIEDYSTYRLKTI